MAASESFRINLFNTLQSRKASSEASERRLSKIGRAKVLLFKKCKPNFLYEHSLNYTPVKSNNLS